MMVKVKRERDEQSPAPVMVGTQQLTRPSSRADQDNEDSLASGNARKRQRQQASALSFSIESIMRGGNSQPFQATTTNKQAMNNLNNNNHHHQNQKLVIEAGAGSHLRVGVDSPRSNCSSVRSNGAGSQNSSTSIWSTSPPPLAESPVSDANNNDRDAIQDEGDSRCDSPQSRLSSPISPGISTQVTHNNNTHLKQQQECKLISTHLNHQRTTSQHSNHHHLPTSVKHNQSSSFSSTSGGGASNSIVAQSSSSTSNTTPATISDQAAASATLQNVECVLENKNDWNRFHALNTEMIITKTGRRMFPVMKVQFSNLDPNRQYAVSMDIVPVDNKRYRYAYHKSCWQVAGKADPSAEPRLYPHPDSPFMGDLLARQVISFEKVKLTNNEMDKSGHIILNSMHKYQPRIHLIDFGQPNHSNNNNSSTNNLNSKPNINNNSKHYQSSTSSTQPQRKIDIEGYRTFVFSETVFTAVTAYQNQLITKLKIEKNPFAKGFRDSSRLSDLDRGDAFDYLGHSMGASGSRYLPGMTSGGGLGGPSALEFAAAAASAAGSHMDAYQLLASAAASQNPWYQSQMQQQQQQQHQHLQQVSSNNSNNISNNNQNNNCHNSSSGNNGNGSSLNTSGGNNINNNSNSPQMNSMAAAAAAAAAMQQHQQQPQQANPNPHQMSSQAAQFSATQLWLAAAFSACLNGAGANAAALAAGAAASGAGSIDTSGGGALGGPSGNNSSAAIN